MMKIVHICDVCKNEFDPKVGLGGSGYGRFSNLTVHLYAREPGSDSSLGVLGFEGSFELCNDCARKVLQALTLWKESGEEESEWAVRHKEFIEQNKNEIF